MPKIGGRDPLRVHGTSEHWGTNTSRSLNIQNAMYVTLSTGHVPVNKDQRHRCVWAAEAMFYLARKQSGPPSGSNVQGTCRPLAGPESGGLPVLLDSEEVQTRMPGHTAEGEGPSYKASLSPLGQHPSLVSWKVILGSHYRNS